MSLLLGKEEHGVIVGQTRTGKTALAKWLLLPRTGNLAIIDPKGDFDFTDCRVISDPFALRRIKPKRFVYRPSAKYFDDLNAYDAVYRYVYEQGHFFCYTDEVVAVVKGVRYPRYFRLCYQMGASKQIKMLSVTQRPSCVPPFIMSEAAKWFVFTLTIPADVDKMRKVLPGYTAKLPDKHTFQYYDIFRDDTRQLIRLTPVSSTPGG